jgi:uncharacterized membrane protein YgdD (TMEM256/DUF423 family)
MRKRYRVLLFAALVAALVVPVGYALSIDSTQTAAQRRYAAVMPTAATAVAAPVMIHRVDDATATSTMLSPVADAAKLLCIGTVLFGLAAAVRKAI